MPCRDFDYENLFGPQEVNRLQKRLDEATRAACEAFRELESVTGKPATRTKRLSDASIVWWHKHQEEDKKRQAAEAERKRVAAIKKEAKSKLINTLTVEEMELIGIDPKDFKR